MDADALKEMYRSMCLQQFAVRRYSGSGGGRTSTDVPVMGNAQPYSPQELVGNIIQGDSRVIVLAEDVCNSAITLPLTTSDKVVIDGREAAIMFPGTRKSLDGELIALELQARG